VEGGSVDRRLTAVLLAAVALVVVPLAVLGAGAPADAVGGATVGTTDATATAASSHDGGSVGQFGGGDANTGHYEGESAPTANPETDWTFNVSVNNTGSGEVKHGGFGYMRSGAVVHDGIAYFGDSGHGIHQKYVYAVNVSTGEMVWRFSPDYEWLAPLGGDVVAEPTVHNGTVYVATACRCGNGNRLWALNATTGAEQWQFQAPDKIWTAPVVANGSVYVGTNENKFYSVDTSDGSLQWANEVFGKPTSPALAEGTVYVTASDAGYPGTNTLYAFDADTGHENWNYSYEPSAEVGSFEAPVVANGMVYLSNNLADDSGIQAFDAHSGAEVWNFSTDGDPNASPAVAGCTVYVGTGSGTVHSLDAANGTERWNVSVPGYVSHQVSIASGTVYVGSNSGPSYDQTSNVTALAAGDGSQRWGMAFDGGIAGSPTPGNGHLIVAEGDRVHAVSGDTGGNASVDYGSCSDARDGTGPTAELHVSHETVSVGETMTFDGSPSGAHGTNTPTNPPSPTSTITEWAFDTDGDGVYELVDTTDGRVEYTYASAGQYTVSVRVTTADNRTATTNRTLTVAPEGDDPTALKTDDWSAMGFDRANTGFNPNTTTPSGDSRHAWTFNVSVENGSGTEIKNGGFGSINDADPVIEDGIAYFGDAGHGIKQKYLYAVNVTTGEKVWRFKPGDEFLGPLSGDVRAAPAVDNDTVYVGTRWGILWGIDAATGGEQWNTTLARMDGSPTVANGTVYVGTLNRSMWAVDADTGTTEWRFDTKGKVWTSPAYDDGTVYVTSSDAGYPGTNYLYAIDADTGDELWNYSYEPSAEVGSFGSPTVAHGRVYLPNNLADTPKIHAFDADTGDELWNYSTNGNPTGDVAVAGCTVYTATGFGTVHALDAGTGTEQWQSTVGGRVNSQVSVANGMLYMTSDTTEQLYVVHAGSGQPAWSAQLDGAANTSPAVGDGMVVAGGGDEMMGFAGLPNASGVDYGSCAAPGENRPPIASLTATGVEVEAGSNVTVDAGSSYDPDGTVTGYDWSVSNTSATVDGTNGTLQFPDEGSYTVGLTVTDDDGANATTNETIYVYEPASEETTTADVTESTATTTADDTPAAEPAAGGTTTEVPTTANGPGFGVVAALVALLAAALFGRRG
jgi:PGF-CTERM protein